MSQTLHQKLVQLHIRASAWLDGDRPKKFDPWLGICHNLTLNQSDSDRLLELIDSDRLFELMAQWPGSSGDTGYPVSHPAMKSEGAFTYATPQEMWRPEYEYARNRWALLDWLIEQTASEADQ